MKPLPRMNERQFHRAKKLIRRQCANYDNGECLPLYDGDVCPCPQLLTRSLICKYFRAAVLPDDAALFAEIMGADHSRQCADCGQPFTPTGNHALYCDSCAAFRERQRKAKWARKTRSRRRRFDRETP